MVSKRSKTIIGLVILAAAIPLSTILLKQSTDNRQHASASDTVTCATVNLPETTSQQATMSATQLQDQIRTNTQNLRKQIAEYRLSLAEKKAALKQQIRANAQTRKTNLIALMRHNPQLALNFIQQNPPGQDITYVTSNCTEVPESVTGTLSISHADYPNNQSNDFYTVRTPDRQVAVHFVHPENITFTPTATVKTSGYALDNDLLVPTTTSDSYSVVSAPQGAASNTGQKNVAIIAMNLTDAYNNVSLSTISNTVFGSVNSYYQNASRNQVSLTGTTPTLVQSELSSTSCNAYNYAESAMNLARSHYNFSNVDLLILVAPFRCGWGGYGSIGSWSMQTPNGTTSMGIALISSFTQGIVTHEVGHTFNIWHAGFINCGSVALGSNCSHIEYGDPYDVMGVDSNVGLLNAAHRAAIGWLNSSVMPTVTATGTFSLTATDSTTTGLKALKVPSKNGAFFVEYRKGLGLIIHQAKVTTYQYDNNGTGESDTDLIDASPPGNAVSPTLAVGSSFIDPSTNIKITFLSNSTTADVRVTIPGTTPATPTPTKAPTPTPTKAPTPTPTRIPTPTPTRVPTATPTPRPSATPTPTPRIPTPTLSAKPTLLSFTVFLHGIGNGGDNANRTSKGNPTPQRTTRIGTISFYDANNSKVLEKTTSLTYQSANGNFSGTLDLGSSLKNGNYLIKVKVPSYLTKSITGIYQITEGQPVQTQPVYLTDGDINNDNAITITDYDILIGCYSDFSPPVSCTADTKGASDLNDDGSVNQYDYNLLLREWTQKSGD